MTMLPASHLVKCVKSQPAPGGVSLPWGLARHRGGGTAEQGMHRPAKDRLCCDGYHIICGVVRPIVMLGMLFRPIKFAAMAIEYSDVLCERCGGRTTVACCVQPVGSTPGARIFDSPACDHSTWREWRRDPVVAPQQQVQRKPALQRPIEPGKSRSQP